MSITIPPIGEKKPVTVAFDCDNTLVKLDNYGEIAHERYDVVRLFKSLSGLGCTMYIWSAGGTEWAKKVRDYCKLEAEVIEKPTNDELYRLPKEQWVFCPDIAVDDFEDCGKITIFV